MEVIDNAIAQLRNGGVLVLVDDLLPKPISYLITNASSITAQQVAFMVNAGKGVICAVLSEEQVRHFRLPMMPNQMNEDGLQFTVSVDARHEVTTGISAADRARTLNVLARSDDPPRDLVMPGHILPIRARKGGVLLHSGPAEAVRDLLSAAQKNSTKNNSVGVLCHILSEQGDILSLEKIGVFCATHSLPSVLVSDIVRQRMATEPLVERISEARLSTKHSGEFLAIAFRSKNDGAEHIALCQGDLQQVDSAGKQVPVLTRVHAEHRIGDLLGTTQLPHRQLIHGALQQINQRGRGIFVYIRHPRKGYLTDQVQAIAQGTKHLPKTAQLRQLGIGAQILLLLGAKRLSLLTNSSREISGIDAFQLEITEHVKFTPVSK